MNIPALFDRLSPQDRDRMITLQRALQSDPGNVRVDFKFVGMCNGLLDKALSRDGRLAFFSWLFGRPISTSHDLKVWEMFNLVVWIGPYKTGNERSDPWAYSKQFMSDLPLIIQLFSGGIGQPMLPGQAGQQPPAEIQHADRAARRQRTKRILKELGYEDE